MSPSEPVSSSVGAVGIKGVAFRGTVDFVRSRLGDDGVKKLLASLPEEVRPTLSRPILAPNFYPFAWLVAMQDSTVTLLGGDRRETLRQLGRFASESALTGVYRIFLKVSSPEMIFEKASRIFGNYFQGIPPEAFRLAEVRKGYGRAEIDRFPGGHADFCRRLDGYFERILELAGGKEVRISHSKCAYRGEGNTCEWVVFWS